MTRPKRSATLLALVLLLAFATTAPAVTLLINGDTPSVRYQRWADRSRMPTPSGIVSLFVVDCPSLPAGTTMGCTDGTTVWVSPSLAPIMRIALMHELGHVLDGQRLTDPQRERFRRIWGRPPLPWADQLAPLPAGEQPNGLAGEQSSAAEWFADAYQACALNTMPARADAIFALALIPVGQAPRGQRLAERRLTATCALIGETTS